MATILIWMAPEPSHILPTIKVARDLQYLNHSVIYLTSGSLHKQLGNLGFRCYQFMNGMLDDGSAGLYSITSSCLQWHDILRNRFAGDHAAVYRAINRNIQEAAVAVGADMILIDSLMNYLHGIYSADVVRSDCPVAFIQTHLRMIMLGRSKSQAHRLISRVHHTIILCPKELELPNYKSTPGRYAEACVHLDRDGMEFPWKWLDASKKLIYCALGSQSRLYPQAPHIFKSVSEIAKQMSDYQFVISAGPYYEELQTIDPPSNCRIFATVPQPRLLEKAAAMILQGGLGSIKECIYFGVPMLVLPFINDQPGNALRVQRHRLGMSVPPDRATNDRICAALERLMEDDSIHTHVREMQAVFRRQEEEKIAAAICDEFLQ